MTKKTNKKPLKKIYSKKEVDPSFYSVFEGEKINERFNRLSNATFEALVFHYHEIIVDVNLSFTRMFGYEREGVLGKSIWILPAWEKQSELKRYIKEKYNKPFETIGIRKDGTSFNCEVIGKELPYKNKKIIVSAIRDITTQVKTRKELAESEERFRVLSESSTEAIFIHNQGIIVLANTAACKLFGYTKSELIGMTPKELATPEYHAIIFHNIKTQNTRPYEVTAVHKNGSHLNIEIKGDKVFYKGNE